MRLDRRHRTTATVLGFALLAAGCGSTVEGAVSGAAPGGSGLTVDSLVADPAAPQLGVSGTPGTGGADAGPLGSAATSDGGSAGSAAQQPSSAGGAGAAGTGGTGGGAVRPEATGAAAPGVTATTLKFGVIYSTDTGEANSAIGADDLDQGDARQYYDALARSVNAAGGIAGRKLVPSYVEKRTTSAETADSRSQAACERWTKDDKVFVVFDGVSEIIKACAEKAGMLNLQGGGGSSNSIASTFSRYPHYVEVSSIAVDRAARLTVDGLARTDYFGTKPVIGVVTWDDANYRFAVEKSLTPAVRRLGFDVAEPAYVTVPQSMAGLSDSGASTSNAVLRFRSAGVTHVMIVDGPAGVFSGTGLTLLFLKSAGSQSYYPRYGMNDSNSPQSGIDAGLWTADDVRGARAVSWGNADEASDRGTSPNTQRKACLDLMAREGIVLGNANAQLAALRACDYVWFLKAVLGTAPAPVSRAGVLAAVNRLGTSYRSPMLFGTRFSPTQHDGIARLRLMALDDACDCFVYTSRPYDAP